MTKTLTITIATVLTVMLAATATLCALTAGATPHQTCGKVNPAQLRQVGDPNYAATLEKLARCGN